jgi:hypothetical protein
LLQLLAGFDERGRCEALAVSAQRSVERALAAVADREVRPVEVDRPFVRAADDDRCDACGLQLLHRGQQLVPGLDRVRIDPGLREQLLVVEEPDLRDQHRHAIDLAVQGVRLDRSRTEALTPLRAHG